MIRKLRVFRLHIFYRFKAFSSTYISKKVLWIFSFSLCAYWKEKVLYWYRKYFWHQLHIFGLFFNRLFWIQLWTWAKDKTKDLKVWPKSLVVSNKIKIESNNFYTLFLLKLFLKELQKPILYKLFCFIDKTILCLGKNIAIYKLINLRILIKIDSRLWLTALLTKMTQSRDFSGFQGK